jgi:hypothetical protein
MRRSARIGVVVAVLAAFAIAFALTPPRGPRSMRQFNAVRLADLEVRMWQAYYDKHRVRLFELLVTLLHEQYHYSGDGRRLPLARAAATFGDPGPLRRRAAGSEAAAKVRSWTGATFDARAVARGSSRGGGAPDPDRTVRSTWQLIAQEYALYETRPRT